MKKLSILILFLLIISLPSLYTSIPASKPEKINNIDKLLTPYQEVIDKLNKELGASFYIPEKNKEKFYNNVKNISLHEFEKKLRYDYKISQSYTNESDSYQNYKRDSAIGKNSGPEFLPNFKGPLHLTPLE